MKLSAVVLAAGKGTRIKSDLPKVLHSICGEPMVVHALESMRHVSGDLPVLVVGSGADRVRTTLGDQARFIVQAQQLGTGHAVLQAKPVLAGHSDLVLVSYADMPLLRAETLNRLATRQRETAPALTMLTVVQDDPRGFGRVVRDAAGVVQAVVKESEATPQQLAIKELNAGVYCFDAEWLWSNLEQIPPGPHGEYFLTDLVGMAVAQGRAVETLTTDDPGELLGINTRVELAEAEAAMRRRINEQWMLAGVTIVDPATTYIQSGVTLGRDTVIYPGTFIEGATQIGGQCRIGPNTVIRDSELGDRCIVLASVIESAVLKDDVDVGPFGHLRKGAHLAQGVHMGNFGEVKNSYLGPGTKMGHFSYVGDTTTGRNVNIGAGTITCNYDGQNKHPTEIEDGAFIGSDTMLVAPVRVGREAKTGAGSVVTRDVPPGSVAYGVPARVKPDRTREEEV